LSSSIPTHFSLDLAGIPSNFHVSVDSLPTITLDIQPLTVELKPLDVTLELKPVDVSLRLKEIPSIRAHLPADFHLGLCVLGFELAALNLCGEAQVITEPYRPNPCEACGEQTVTKAETS
jgi:hypothetical protein